MTEQPESRAVYDSRETGYAFNVTYRLGDRTITFQEPIPDPFGRFTLNVSWRDRLKSLLRRDMPVTVLVGADHVVIEAVLELDANYRGEPLSARRRESETEVRKALRRFGKEVEAAESSGDTGQVEAS